MDHLSITLLRGNVWVIYRFVISYNQIALVLVVLLWEGLLHWDEQQQTEIF